MNEKLDAELMALFDKLVASEARVDQIEQIDYQLKTYKENPKLHILPNTCKWMTPALEEYAEDPESWLRFIKRVRREFPKRTQASKALGEVYRRVYSRVDAQIRRGRLARAVEAHIKTHGHFVDGKEEKAYADTLNRYWALGRENTIAGYRRQHGVDKLSYDEQTDVYDAYWDQINAEIKAGNVPHNDTLPQRLAEAKRANRLYYGDKPKNQESL